MKLDIFGKTPKIEDRIVFNPPKYKGIIYGICMGFTKEGLPKLQIENLPGFGHWSLKRHLEKYGYYVPKTNFVIVNL